MKTKLIKLIKIIAILTITIICLGVAGNMDHDEFIEAESQPLPRWETNIRIK